MSNAQAGHSFPYRRPLPPCPCDTLPQTSDAAHQQCNCTRRHPLPPQAEYLSGGEAIHTQHSTTLVSEDNLSSPAMQQGNVPNWQAELSSNTNIMHSMIESGKLHHFRRMW